MVKQTTEKKWPKIERKAMIGLKRVAAKKVFSQSVTLIRLENRLCTVLEIMLKALVHFLKIRLPG